MSRRHPSLFPLSHQHQHALALAVMIRRHFGEKDSQAAWVEEMAGKVSKLYAAELAAHFDVEETVLFPEMERHLGRLELIAELRKEHLALRDFVRSFEAAATLQRLEEFAAELDRHVRKEERGLFPEFEKRMPVEEARRVGMEIEARLSRSCPLL